MPDRAAIGQLLRSGERSYSFEFFPPQDAEGEEVLWRSISELEPLGPTFVSVTYGAGGSTRERTLAVTRRIVEQGSHEELLTRDGRYAELYNSQFAAGVLV